MKVKRPKLDDLDISIGKKTRLYRLLYEHGPANGTLMVLPIDQGIEHGPLNFFVNPPSEDPDFQYRLALEGSFSGIALHIGLAEKYSRKYVGKVPLILKINGKTNVPSDDNAFSPLTASVEDAVRLGADAVGYTLYAGSPSQDRDIRQLNEVRYECAKFGMPLIVWAYPRGSAIDAKGGKDSLYAVDYAARLACEFGADVVKLNVPKIDESKMDKLPKPYNTLKLSYEEAIAKVVHAAGRTMVLFSGGSKESDQDLLHKAKAAMDNGATGLIFGRNMWQREHSDALKISSQIKKLMLES
ncbi:MAG: fructose-bisphosphate aldolase [Candidatus Melainabacteria bacterium]|nr:fructose-bisphosphate aldolase [Candidatus Melainabacteria bacterium]